MRNVPFEIFDPLNAWNQGLRLSPSCNDDSVHLDGYFFVIRSVQIGFVFEREPGVMRITSWGKQYGSHDSVEFDP